MLELASTAQYRRDFKRVIRRGLNTALLKKVIQQLREQKPLDPKHKDHPLKGSYAGLRECHIQPDWLLIFYCERYSRPRSSWVSVRVVVRIKLSPSQKFPFNPQTHVLPAVKHCHISTNKRIPSIESRRIYIPN